jgi:hypothetical protein
MQTEKQGGRSISSAFFPLPFVRKAAILKNIHTKQGGTLK